MKDIHIKTIPHQEQRYPTVGDYFEDDDTIEFRISRVVDDVEFLVLIHELIEYYLTSKHKIPIKDIDAFDMEFERKREMGFYEDWQEPGDDLKAPYYKEHQVASAIERLMALQLGINWCDYENKLLKL